MNDSSILSALWDIKSALDEIAKHLSNLDNAITNDNALRVEVTNTVTVETV